MESYEHKKAVQDYLDYLSSQGWRAINLKGRSPDGIAVKDGQVVAIEILLRKANGKYPRSISLKRYDYRMFDDVIVKNVIIEKEKKNYGKLLQSDREAEGFY